MDDEDEENDENDEERDEGEENDETKKEDEKKQNAVDSKDEPTEITFGGKYKMGSALGKGSFGEIYIGTNTLTNELVAIKLV